MKFKGVLPPTYLCIAIVVMVGLHLLLPLIKLQLYPWSLLGIIPLLLGIAINLIADGAFKANDIIVKPFEESNVLITTGVFRISRNPMYLGFVLMLTGIAVLLESLSSFFVIPAFLVFTQVHFIRVEEKMLEETFQDAWISYKKKVRRWI